MKKSISGLFVVSFLFVAFSGVAVAQDSGPSVPPHEVYGAVTDSNRDPVSEAELEASVDGEVVDSAVTDSNGEYFLRVSPEFSGEVFTVTVGDQDKEFTAEVGASERYDVEVSDSVGGGSSFSVSVSDEDVLEGSEVDLEASVDNGGSDLSYDWSIVDDPTGQSVLDGDGGSATFTAPSVGSDAVVEVEVEVEDSSGDTVSGTADVTVEDSSVLEDDSGSAGGVSDDEQDQQDDQDQQDQRPEAKTVEAEVSTDEETGRTNAEASVENVEEDQRVEVEIPDTSGESDDTDDSGPSVESVSFTSSSSSDSVSVSVSDIGVERPETVSEDAGSDVYSYQEINVDGVEDEDITESTVNFKVRKSFLEERDRAPEDVVMKRYNDGWDELDTRVDEELDDAYRFESSSTGFSYYAIALQEQDEQVFTEASIGVSSLNVTPTSGNPPFDVEVQVEVENTGNASGSENITVTSGNETIGSEVVELGSGSWTALTFDHTIEEKGEIEFSSGFQSVTVNSGTEGVPWIGVLALILAVLGGLYFRRDEVSEKLEEFREDSDDSSEENSDDSDEDDGDLEYTCDECGASFDSERGLHIHQGEVHEDEDE